MRAKHAEISLIWVGLRIFFMGEGDRPPWGDKGLMGGGGGYPPPCWVTLWSVNFENTNMFFAGGFKQKTKVGRFFETPCYIV